MQRSRPGLTSKLGLIVPPASLLEDERRAAGFPVAMLACVSAVCIYVSMYLCIHICLLLHERIRMTTKFETRAEHELVSSLSGEVQYFSLPLSLYPSIPLSICLSLPPSAVTRGTWCVYVYVSRRTLCGSGQRQNRDLGQTPSLLSGIRIPRTGIYRMRTPSPIKSVLVRCRR